MADRAVQHFVHVRAVAKEVRKVEHQELGHERGKRGVRRGNEFHGADDGQLDRVPLVAEGVVGVDLDVYPDVRRRGQLSSEQLERLHRWLVGGAARAGLDSDLAVHSRPAAQRRGEVHQCQCEQEVESRLHRIPSQRGRSVTASGKSVITASTATMASTGRSVQIATSLMLCPAMVQATKRVAP